MILALLVGNSRNKKITLKQVYQNPRERVERPISYRSIKNNCVLDKAAVPEYYEYYLVAYDTQVEQLSVRSRSIPVPASSSIWQGVMNLWMSVRVAALGATSLIST